MKNTEVNHKLRGVISGFFGLLALICFIATFIFGFAGEYLLDDGSQWVLIAAFGGAFLFAGLSVGTAGQMPGFLFAFLGFLITGGAGVYGLGSEVVKTFLINRVIPVFALSIFIIVGICFLVIPQVVWHRKESKYTYKVTAEVVGKTKRVSRDSDGHRHIVYVLDWKYYAGGLEHSYHSPHGRRPEPRMVGDRDVLYLDPENFKDVWERPDRMEKILFAFLGFSFLAAGSVSMVFFLIQTM